MTAYAEVAINTPSGKTFTYLLPENLKDKLSLYQRVNIPLGTRKTIGFIVSFPESTAVKGLKPVDSLYDPFPVITPKLVELANWVSHEYCSSLGLTLHGMYPDKLKYFPTRKKEWRPEGGVSPVYGKYETVTVEAPLSERLLYYANEAKNIVKNGGSALLIVPEVALIETFAKQIEEKIGSPVVCYSSRLSHGKAFEALSKMLAEAPKVIVSTRQAVFLPINGLSLIMIEEENADSYKSDETPRFSTVDTAVQRGKIEGFKVLLGSYSLSLKTRYIHKSVYKKSSDLSPVSVIDFYDFNKVISYKADKEIKEQLKSGGRAVVMATRKGFSTSLRCKKCGNTFNCNACGVPMVLHKENNSLVCRYCGKKEARPVNCGSCGGEVLTAAGVGVEKIEQELKKTMKYVPMERVDTELLSKGSEKKSAFKRFIDGKTELIVGTQLALPYVRHMEKGVVVLIGFDYVMNLPVFDATEKAMEMLLQLLDAVRPGVKIIIQVMKENNRIGNVIKRKLLEEFKLEELKMRAELKYPPFCRLGEISVTGKTEEEAEAKAELFKESMEKSGIKDIEILGPIAVNVPSRKGKTAQLLVKGKAGVSDAIWFAINELETKYSSVRKNLDITIK